MSRDFHSLDRLRLDKYLYLIRCYVGVAFDLFIKNGLRNHAESEKKQTTKRPSKVDGDREEGSKQTGKKRKRAEQDSGMDDWADLENYVDMLEEGPLSPLNFNGSLSDPSAMPKGPDGIRYHLMDIWLDELEKCVTHPVQDSEEVEDVEPKTKLKDGIPMDLLLRPIERLKEKGLTRTVRKRAAETLEDDRLVAWGIRERKNTDHSDDDEEWGGIDD